MGSYFSTNRERKYSQMYLHLIFISSNKNTGLLLLWIIAVDCFLPMLVTKTATFSAIYFKFNCRRTIVKICKNSKYSKKIQWSKVKVEKISSLPSSLFCLYNPFILVYPSVYRSDAANVIAEKRKINEDKA